MKFILILETDQMLTFFLNFQYYLVNLQFSLMVIVCFIDIFRRPYVDPSLLPVIPAANYGNTQNKKMRFQSNSQVGKEQISGDGRSSLHIYKYLWLAETLHILCKFINLTLFGGGVMLWSI